MLSSFILRFLEWGLFALLWGALVLAGAIAYDIWLSRKERVRKYFARS